MARPRHQIDPLVELSELDAEPSLVGAAHIGRDKTRGDLFVSVTIGPIDFAPAIGSGLNNSPSNESI
jgi:hypothetical protein